MSLKITRRGTTLAEAVIYLAIFSLVMTSTIATTYQLMKTDEQLTERQIINEEADFINRKIDWLLTGATNINIRGPDSLEVTNHGRVYTLTLDHSDQSLTLNNLRLNSQRVKIEQLEFTEAPPNQLIINFEINRRNIHLEYLTPT